MASCETNHCQFSFYMFILSALLRFFYLHNKIKLYDSYRYTNRLLISERFMHQHLRYIGSLLIFIITGVIIPILLYKINNYLSIFILMWNNIYLISNMILSRSRPIIILFFFIKQGELGQCWVNWDSVPIHPIRNVPFSPLTTRTQLCYLKWTWFKI